MSTAYSRTQQKSHTRSTYTLKPRSSKLAFLQHPYFIKLPKQDNNRLMCVRGWPEICRKKESASISIVLESQANDSHHEISKERYVVPMLASRGRSAIAKPDKECFKLLTLCAATNTLSQHSSSPENQKACETKFYHPTCLCLSAFCTTKGEKQPPHVRPAELIRKSTASLGMCIKSPFRDFGF